MLQSQQGHQIIQTANGQQLVVQSLPTGQHVQVMGICFELIHFIIPQYYDKGSYVLLLC